MIRHIVMATLFFSLTPALAEDSAPEEGDSSIGTPDLSILTAALGGQQPGSVLETPVDGLYEVRMGAQILYISENGRFVMQGDLIDLQTRDNLTEVARNGLRAESVNALAESDMVVFGPEDAPHTVTVFTDIDCGYCRKLHSEIASYADQGIRIRYLAFPRAGVGSESFDKAVSVWCADDPQTAMTQAKLGEAVAPKSCANPVADQYQLGQSLGVRGTPSLVLENGQMVPGYVPASQLRDILQEAVATAPSS